MSAGIGTQFTATLAAGQTQTWFTYGWDPNDLVIWSMRPTSIAVQVRLEGVLTARGESGITYFLTVTNSGSGPATFEARYYVKTIVAEGEWRSLGPNHLSGCIVQVAIDPSDSDRLYAVAQGGGLWKLESVAGYPADSWVPLTDQHPSLTGFAVAIAPSDSSILYLAEGSSLLRSGDRGATWSSASPVSVWSGSDPWSHAVRRIVVDPHNANRVLVASNTGLWQTTDGGTTWAALIAGDVTDVALDPGDPRIVYAAQRFVGVLRSTTGAAPWATILAWNAAPNPANTMIKLALGRELIAGRTVAVKLDRQVFVNHTAGSGAWTSSSLPPDADNEQQGDWNNVMAIDPFDSRVMLAGNQELFRSSDGGQTWAVVATYYHPHEDQQSLAFDERHPGVVYVSNDGGVFRSSDGGVTWMSGASWGESDVFSGQDLNYGLVTSLFYRVGVSPGSGIGPVAVGPAHHQGLLASRFVKGEEWDGIQGHSWEGANTYSFANEPAAFYLVQGSDLWRQQFPLTNTAADLVQILPGIGIWPHALAMNNEAASTLLFAGTSSGQIKYTFGPSASAPVWQTVSGLNVNEPFVSIVFSSSSAGLAYAVTQSGRVFLNPDVGSPVNWIDMRSNWQGGAVVQAALHPSHSDELYLITGAQIAKSTDGGATWHAINGATAAALGTTGFQSIVASPMGPDTVFVAGNPGVFVSSDAGATWISYGQGLPNASVSWLQFAGGYLYAATWGRGLWRRAPFASPQGDNVDINTQFTATIGAGQSHTWFTWGWPQNWFVVWSVRPLTDAAQVALDRVDVELGPPGLTYSLTISNTGTVPATFEAKYAFVAF